MMDKQVRYMVERFLSWKLPTDFNPDAGITFKADYNEETPWPMKHEPTGTNLFSAAQATVMVRHMMDGMPLFPTRDFAWLIEAPGQYYLSTRNLGTPEEFYWTKDHGKALRFYSAEQADVVMMAVRYLYPDLFAFARALEDAKSVEHGWLFVPADPAETHGDCS